MTKQDKVEKVMHEWKVGTLTSNGRKVTDYDQAVAIALSEAGLSKYEKNETMDKMNKGGLIDAPKIYVADLEAYNNGKLVGEWLDLSDFEDGKDVSKEISKLLKKWGAEEYAIHDVENVPSSMYSEYMGEEDFDKIIKIYKASEESDLPYEVISEIILQYEPEDLEEWISDHYEGHFDNDTDLAYSVVENMGSVSDLGEKTTEMYFDYEGFGRDLAINDEWEGDFDSDEDRGYDYVENMGGVSELGDKTIDMYFDYEKFGRDLAIDDYTEIEDGYYFRTPRYAKGGLTNERRYVNKDEDYETRYAKDKPMRKGYKAERKFAVGGEVGNKVSFKGDYGTPRSGIVKEKRGSSYIVATDDGDRLVDSYEVISFSEAPIEKKKRFGFFEGGGEMTKFAEGGLVKVTRGFYKGFEKFKDKIIIPLGISASKNGLDRYKMPKTSVGVGFQLAKKMKGMSYDTFHLAIKDDEIVLLLTPTGQRTIKINVELKNYTFQFVIDSVKESVNEYLKPSKYEGGGKIDNWMNAEAGDSARVISENKMGLIIKDYGRKFHLKFVDGSEKTYDASELEFYRFEDEDEMYEGGGEIQSKIDKLNKVVNSKMLPEGVKTKAKAEIEKLEKQLHESKETKAEEKEEHKPEVITDKSDVQKIKNSIQEGESILKSGKINGRKLSEGELESTLNSVNKSRAKIGLPKPEAKEPKFKIGDVVGLDLDERTPKMITSFKTNRKGEIIYSGYYIPFPNEKWNYEESEIVLLKVPSKPTTRKAPVKKAAAKKTEVKKEVETPAKPKADHKKLLAKIKAKKGDKEYDNKASLNPETGERRKRSESSDKKREALPLGKRVSASGNKYYENRLNRADMNKEDKFEEGGEVKSSGWGLKFLKW